MAYIRHIPPSRAAGRLAHVYREVREEVPRVPNLLQVFSLRPELMETVFRSWLSIMWGGRLPRELKEMIAIATSKAARCDYCVDSHLVFLLATGLDTARAFEVETKLADAAWLDDRQRAALRLCARIASDTRTVSDGDIGAFAAAWPAAEERAELLSVIAAICAITRMANALGVGFELPTALRRFETTRRGSLSLLARVTTLSVDLAERSLRARTPEENHTAAAKLFTTKIGFSGPPPGFLLLEACPEIFDGQLRTIEKTLCVMPRDRWMRVGLVIGKLTGCGYFADQCGRWLVQRGVDPTTVIAASEGAGSMLSDVEEACLRFTRDITLHSHTIGEDRVRELRALGLSDGAILDLAYVGGVLNGVAGLMRVLMPLEERAAA
jgi:AhpD family alkylhydroperoxidase